MARFALAMFLLATTLVSASPALGQEELEQPSAPGGLGNTRSDLDVVYGEVERTDVTDFGDYASDAVSYEDEWVFYLIEDGTTPSPDDRAFIIHRYAEAFESFAYAEAIEIANQLLPADVVPTSDLLPFELNGTVIEYRQTFSSEAIARLFPDPEVYREGDPGTVWLVLTPDAASADPGSNFVNVNVRIEHP
jgi:hypothetical protein